MKNNENTGNNIEINDENVENNVISDDNTEDTSANTDNSAEEKTTELTVEEQLEAAKKEVEQYKDKYLRAIAEFDNYKKRTMKEKAELILNGGEKTITALLPVLDDFERALADKGEDATAVREGFQLIMKKLEKILEGLGVRPIDTKDKDFDVDFHEAIAMVPAGDDQKGKVIDCVQTGYTLNDKVIRHAKVAVGQ